MSSNISATKCKAWMKKNDWDLSRVNKHETWIYNGVPASEKRTININFHRKKGEGMADDALRDIALIMGIKFKDLVEKIRNKV